MNIRNFFVDYNGRTYRVALTDSGKALIVARRDHQRHDVGRALLPEGRIGKHCVQAAREQMEHDRAC